MCVCGGGANSPTKYRRGEESEKGEREEGEGEGRGVNRE